MPSFSATDVLTIEYYGWEPAHVSGGPPVVRHHGFAVDAAVNRVLPGSWLRGFRHIVDIPPAQPTDRH